MKGLARRTRQGIAWTILNSIVANIVRIAVIAVLGRMLAPGDFGVVAAAMTVIQLGNSLRDLGVGIALVQRKELVQEHVEAAFTFSVGLGAFLGAVLFAGAGVIGDLYHIPESVGIIRVLSVLFLLRGVSLVPQFMCRREMSFRALAIADLAAYLAGATLSIVLAVAGFGAWAIAWGYVVETSVNVAILLVLAPPPRRLRIHYAHLKELLGFGLGQSAATLANYFANQGDYMVVGNVLGKTSLGFYQRAYELVRFPATVFSNIAGSVLFSAFAKVQDDPERKGRAFRRAMFACAIVLLPASAGLVVLAPEVIRIILGPHWGEAVWPFRIMSVTMLFRTTYKLGALVGRSSGEVFQIAAWQAIYAVMVIGGAAISIHWDILGVSVTTALAIVVVFAGLSHIGLKSSHLGVRDMWAAHASPLLCAGLVGGAAWGVAFVLRQADAPYYAVAAAGTAAGSLVFLVFVAVGVKAKRGDWPWLVETTKGFLSKKSKKKKPVLDEPASL